MLLAKTLSFYKRDDIREEMIRQSANKEIGVHFDGGTFGKRPDVLKYPQDVLEFVQNKATSFHCSEELWGNPLLIKTGMNKREADSLRVGWDLILDIDCPIWEFSKLITYLFIKSLQDHGIKSVTCKFSGNKGFHIAVPWQAFPEKIANQQVKDLFPEAPKKIAYYLLDYISSKYIRVTKDNSVFFDKKEYSIEELKKIFSRQDFIEKRCLHCRKRITEQENKYEFHCRKEHYSAKSNEESLVCPKCGLFMDRYEMTTKLCSCKNKAEIVSRFNPSTIVEVDTILISSRHLYRMPFSMHEKTWLVSVPVEPKRVLEFEKTEASPENANVKIPFLDRKNAEKGEAGKLLTAAYDFFAEPNVDEKEEKPEREFEIPEEAIPEQYFPPCITKGLEGLNDGKKRFMFILINFLYSCGWGPEQVDKIVIDWNKRNPEPLRDTIILSQLKREKTLKKKILPPNCDAPGYYKDLGLCPQNNDHAGIKNPVQYAKKQFKARGKVKTKTKKETKKKEKGEEK
ncbi:MAG: hypothetical protein V1659_01215 [Candidatus Woesearchaeota archaeon]